MATWRGSSELKGVEVYVRLFFCLFGALACIAVSQRARAATEESPLRFVFALTTSSVTAPVTREDVLAGIEVWLRTLAGTPRYNVHEKSQFCFIDGDNLQAIDDAFSTARVDAMGLLSLEYLALEGQVKARPILSPVFGEGVPQQHFVLIANSRLGAESLADLRGKPLAVQGKGNEPLEILWIASLLQEFGLPEPRQFFSSGTVASNPGRAVLECFFGNMAVVCVAEETYLTTIELNPAIERGVTVIARSPLLQPATLVLRQGAEGRVEDVLELALARDADEHQNAQLLMLFSFRRTVPYEPSHLDSVRQLRQRYLETNPAATNHLHRFEPWSAP